jgi:hypothetical protein
VPHKRCCKCGDVQKIEGLGTLSGPFEWKFTLPTHKPMGSDGSSSTGWNFHDVINKNSALNKWMSYGIFGPYLEWTDEDDEEEETGWRR